MNIIKTRIVGLALAPSTALFILGIAEVLARSSWGKPALP